MGMEVGVILPEDVAEGLISRTLITSSPASSCFITTLLLSCSNRPKAKCFLDPTASMGVQPIATASKIAFAAAH